jgi:hypothetical protein
MVTRRSAGGFSALVLCTLAAAGCEIPNFEGAQIQEPPAGFLLQDDSYQRRPRFPDREVLQHTAWIRATGGPYSGIYINAHPGDLTADDVSEAQEAAKLDSLSAEVTFGGIEAMTIDGRTAWGWSERLETVERGLDWVAYRTVVSYDTISYAIEFYTGDPGTKLAAPDTLKTVIASFAIGETRVNLPLVALLGGVLLLGVSVARSRAKERAARLQDINLVKIKKPGEEEGEGRVIELGEEVPSPPSGPPAAPASSTELG